MDQKNTRTILAKMLATKTKGNNGEKQDIFSTKVLRLYESQLGLDCDASITVLVLLILLLNNRSIWTKNTKTIHGFCMQKTCMLKC